MRSNYANVLLFEDVTLDQTEVSIAVDPNDPLQLLVGANNGTAYGFTGEGCQYESGCCKAGVHLGYYYSTDAGSSWDYDTLPGTVTFGSDPVVAFDDAGNAYYAFVGGLPIGIYVSKAPGGPPGWDPRVTVSNCCEEDKPHMTVDIVSNDQNRNNIYVAWMDRDERNISFSWSPGEELLFSVPIPISDTISGDICQGVNLAVGPDGTVYAAWAIHDNGPLNPETAIGFNWSADGGVNWDGAVRILDDVAGIFNVGGSLPDKEINVHTWPVMAIDTSVGGTGIVYLVWAEETDPSGGDADVFLIRSFDGGNSWSDPVKVNTDNSGNDQWFPWVTVTAGGHVYVVFYDNRNDPGNFVTEVWVTHSSDSGSSFIDFRVGDVAFEPNPVPPTGFMYIGDYIGITSSEEYVYACWSDNRIPKPNGYRGVYQAFVGVIPLDIDTVSGMIASNTEWDWTVVLDGDVTVAAGVTLKIKPSAKIIIEPNGGNPVNIDVYGTLEILDGGRPHFFSDSTAGAWSGIRIGTGGSVDWGNGCIISDAIVGVTIDAGASSTDIANVTVENASASGFRLSEAVTLIGDTVVGIVSGYGIQVLDCDPVIKDCYIEGCDYGIYLRGSSGTLRGNTITGSGSYGVYLVTDPEDQGADTLKFVDNSITGYFSGAHLYAGNKAHCDIDSCEFVADTGGTQSPYGIKAKSLAWVKLRHSLIKDYDSAGFYSDESVANLGDDSDWGNNSIFNTACDSTCYAYSVVHIPGFIPLGPMGPGGPGPFLPALKAENNWWGHDSPDSSSLFSGPVDFRPWLTSDPLGKRISLIVQTSTVPHDFSLDQNYPNPFNPSTVIQFSLPTAAKARIEVFNILGQRVKRLVDREFAAGQHRITWDGTDDRGRSVASGVYLYRVISGEFIESKKMVLLR